MVMKVFKIGSQMIIRNIHVIPGYSIILDKNSYDSRVLGLNTVHAWHLRCIIKLTLDKYSMHS